MVALCLSDLGPFVGEGWKPPQPPHAFVLGLCSSLFLSIQMQDSLRSKPIQTPISAQIVIRGGGRGGGNVKQGSRALPASTMKCAGQTPPSAVGAVSEKKIGQSVRKPCNCRRQANKGTNFCPHRSQQGPVLGLGFIQSSSQKIKQ